MRCLRTPARDLKVNTMAPIMTARRRTESRQTLAGEHIASAARTHSHSRVALGVARAVALFVALALEVHLYKI